MPPLIGSHGAPSLRFPLRRTMLLGGAAAGACALASIGWLWKASCRNGWQGERQRLEIAVAQLSLSLGEQQASEGGFGSGPYLDTPAVYHTAQALAGLMTSVRMKKGDFAPVKRDLAFKALAGKLRGWKKGRCDLSLIKPGAIRGDGAPSETAGVAWAMIAFSRYVEVDRKEEARQLNDQLAEILVNQQLEDGSFAWACDPVNHGHSHAYATAMAVWPFMKRKRWARTCMQ